MTLTVALSGDAIINRRISTCSDPGFLTLVERFQGADVGFTHLETLIHDFDGTACYPAAQAGGTWMRSPAYVADELAWAGIDIVSLASNHALDYGYGALRSTWSELDRVGICSAGTGETLADARSPSFLDVQGARIGLVSMTTSFPAWSRAGERRPDMAGRPGLNPLGWYHEINRRTLDQITALAQELGKWVIELEDGVWGIHPPGLHNSLTRYRVGDVDRPTMMLDERDRSSNLRAISEASTQSDLVIAHIHNHAWRSEGDLADPPECIERFARAAIDAGADIVLNQGSHAPLRGIEVYDGCPIFYDPGDLMLMNRSGISLPMEFYRRFEHDLENHPWEATPSSAQNARPSAYNTAINPRGGYQSLQIEGLVVPVCEFDTEFRFTRAELIPAEFLDIRIGDSGIPTRVRGERANEILQFIEDRSAIYGTNLDIGEDRGTIHPDWVP